MVLNQTAMMFDHAVHELDALFPPARPEEPSKATTAPTDSDVSHQPTVISDPDAIAHRVLCAVDTLQVGQGSPTRQTCVFKGKVIAVMEFDAAHDFGDSQWNRIEALIANGQFPPPQTVTEADVVIQAWQRHSDVPLLGLCSSTKAMFFYRPPTEQNTFVCSPTYSHLETEPSATTRYVLAAAILAVISDLGMCHTAVHFKPLSYPTVSAGDSSHRIIDLYDSAYQTAQPLEERASISIFWKPFCKPLHEAYLRVPDTFLEKNYRYYRYIPDDTEIPLAAGAGPDITVDKRITETFDGYVFRGALADGARVIVKVTDVRQYRRGPGWQASITEALRFRALLTAGLAQYTPEFRGLWQGAEMTLFVTTDVGVSFNDWEELSDAQWEQFCAAVRAFHRAGFHHGDLLPRNVCCDELGTVRLIDFGCTIQCACRKQCIDFEDLEAHTDRPFLHD